MASHPLKSSSSHLDPICSIIKIQLEDSFENLKRISRFSFINYNHNFDAPIYILTCIWGSCCPCAGWRWARCQGRGTGAARAGSRAADGSSQSAPRADTRPDTTGLECAQKKDFHKKNKLGTTIKRLIQGVPKNGTILNLNISIWFYQNEKLFKLKQNIAHYSYKTDLTLPFYHNQGLRNWMSKS